MSGDCLLLRKEVKQLSIKLHKDSNNCVLRQTFASHRKEYNKLRKNLRNNYFSSLVNKVNSLNPKHSKSFWNALKDTTPSKINPAIPISSDEWVNYSKSLLQYSLREITTINSLMKNYLTHKYLLIYHLHVKRLSFVVSFPFSRNFIGQYI